MLYYRLRQLLAIIGLSSCSALVQGELWDTLYVEGGVAWDYPESINLDSSDASIDLDSGVYDFSGSLGARLSNNWRVEFGWQSFRNTPEILFGSQAELELDSDELDFLKTKSYMVSALRDFKIGRALQPYVGIGVGLATVDLRFSEASVNGLFLQRSRVDVINDKDSAFAVQAIAGITVPVTSWLDLAADYRYLKAPSVDLSEVDGSPLSFGHGVQSAWLRVRLHAPDADRANLLASQRARPNSKSRTTESGDQSRFYYALRGGGGFSEDMGLENELTIDAFDPGPTFALAVGYHLNPRVRFELEGGYRFNRVEVIELGPDIGEDAASGDVSALSLMANAFYVFNPEALIRPFIGVGVGVVRADFDIEVFGFCANLVCGPERRELFVDASDTAAALQVMAGAEVVINSRLKFTADYRYLNSARMSVSRPNGDIFRGNMRNTSVVMGLRFAL